MWAVPGGTAIPGQPEVEQEQASKSPPTLQKLVSSLKLKV